MRVSVGWRLGRGSVAAAVVVGMMLALPLSAGASVSQSADWQGDAAHSGDISGAGVTPPLTAAWESDTGGNVNQSVAIDNDRVFAIKAYPYNSSSYDQTEDLEALDISTGAVYWSQPFGVFYPGDPAFVTAENGIATLTYDGLEGDVSYTFVAGYDESTGQQLWSEALPEGNEGGGPETPLTSNGVFYVDGGGGLIDAIDEQTGAILWHSGQMPTSNPPVLSGSTIVAAGVCQSSYGFSAATGATLWQDGDAYGGGTTEAASDGSLVWSADSGDGNCDNSPTEVGTVYDPSSGAITASFSGYTPAFADGIGVQVVGDASTGDGYLQGFDPATGSTLWSISEPTDSTQSAAQSSMPLFVDGLVYVEEPEGQLLALDPSTGAVQWQGQVGDPDQHGGFVEDSLNGLAAGDGYLIAPTNTGIEAFATGSSSGATTGSGGTGASGPSTGPTDSGSPTSPTNSGSSPSSTATTGSTASPTGSANTTPATGTASPSGRPAAVTGARLRAAARATVTAGHRAEVKLSCSGAGGTLCSGKLTLTVSRRVTVRRTIRGKTRRVVKTERLTLATGRYSLKAGKAITLRLALTRTADALISASPKHQLKVVATARATAGTAPRLTVTLTRPR